MDIHPQLHTVTERIRERSTETRARYLRRLEQQRSLQVQRAGLGCTNLAHGYAAAPKGDKIWLRAPHTPNIGIVSAYNDMLSAHQPLQEYPAWIKEAAREVGATAQFAGGVPAMCDGVTQGKAGMELSLFSRDVIALSTAVALSHHMFDATLCLGICDKIVPGLLIGALSFGHLPTIFVPGGPMPSGVSNDVKAKTRQRFAAGEIGEAELLLVEEQSYHSAGTCTFYGTANSNQMLMEVMGLHLPGSAFINPGTPLREALTREAAHRVLQLTAHGQSYTPIGHVVDERAIVNGIVGLLATGGSTNHTMHLVAIARAAGVIIDWTDFDQLSAAIPLLARVYPNGKADVNQFHEVGGLAFLIRELLGAGLLHGDVLTVAGQGLAHYTRQPVLEAEDEPAEDLPEAPATLRWIDAPEHSGNLDILRTAAEPFSPDGGLRLLAGNLGRAVIKVSAVKPEHRIIEAPALLFGEQEELLEAYQRGELDRDFIAIVLGQGPQANGMPELHSLTPTLTNLQDKGFKVALVTDGRMSGASGKVPAAIHVTPESMVGGPLGKVRQGDLVRLDAVAGTLDALVPADEWAQRAPSTLDRSHHHELVGRELFGGLRASVTGAEQGAHTFGPTF